MYDMLVRKIGEQKRVSIRIYDQRWLDSILNALFFEFYEIWALCILLLLFWWAGWLLLLGCLIDLLISYVSRNNFPDLLFRLYYKSPSFILLDVTQCFGCTCFSIALLVSLFLESSCSVGGITVFEWGLAYYLLDKRGGKNWGVYSMVFWAVQVV